MSSYASLGTSGQTVMAEQQYKALFGFPGGKIGQSLSAEMAGSSRLNIFSNQLFRQEIPSPAPTDLTPQEDVLVFDPISQTNIVIGKRQTSIQYPWIVKYSDILLNSEELTLGRTYRSINANSRYSSNEALQIQNNLLTRGIPLNFDGARSYSQVMRLTRTDVTPNQVISAPFGGDSFPWSYNNNSGIIIFTGTALTTSYDVRFTFWRYEGETGFPTSGLSGTGGTGATGATGESGSDGATGATGPTGANGVTGPTGERGERGYTGEKGDTGFAGKDGDRYLTEASANIVPVLTGSVTFDVEPGLSYTQGISVIVVNESDYNSRFNGIITNYNKANGSLTLSNIFGINGSNFGDSKYIINLDGIMGPTGNTGPRGQSGEASNTGATGPTGERGEKGDIGFTGDKGDKGDKGDAGNTGPTGFTGPKGDQGFTGDKGNKGDTGMTGATGPRGQQGQAGFDGPQGATGPTGDRGDTGIKGDRGDTGFTGSIGDTGATGPTGDKGDTGLKGDRGDTGIKGDKGDTGPTGQKGDRGEIGYTGVTGSPGPTGYTGATGEKGDKGDTGPAGDKYLSSGFADIIPIYGQSTSFTIQSGLSYIKGNSVIVVNSNTNSRFEGTVFQYNPGNGDITITNISNIVGSSFGQSIYNVNLDGIDGPEGPRGHTGDKGDNGNTGPSGATGPTGERGERGEKGFTGEKGDVGQKGEIGHTGPAGPSFTTSNPPPDVVFGTIFKNASDIYIPIIYPNQVYVDMLPQPLPTIRSSKFDISYNNASGTTIGATILNTSSIPFDPSYVNGRFSDAPGAPTILDNRPLTGIIIKNSSANPSQTNPAKPIPAYNTFLTASGSETRWSIIYHLTNFSITNTTQNSITGYYTSYSTTSNPSVLNFGIFAQSQPPTADASFTQLSANTVSITLRINPPTLTSKDGTPGVTIKEYNTIASTPGSSIRYPDPVSQSLSLLVPSASASSTTYSSLYPDSQYSFNINTTNSLGQTSASTYDTDPSFIPLPVYSTSTLGLAIIPANTNISSFNTSTIFNTTFASARFVSNDNTVSNLFNSTDIVTKSLGPYSINLNSNTRGKLGTNAIKLMDISANISGTNYAIQPYKSFPIPGSETVNTGGIIISHTGGADQYSITGSTGFYSRTGNITLTLPKGKIQSSGTLYNYNIEQNYYNADDTFALRYSPNPTIQFYYSDVNANPVVNGATATFTSATTKISGLSVITSNPNIDISFNASNMGEFFYPSSGLATYTMGSALTGTLTESNVANVLASSKAGGKFSSIIYLNRSITATANSNVYSRSSSIGIAARNLFGSSSSVNASFTSQALFDIPSNNWRNSTTSNPTSIQVLSAISSAKSGYRVWSAPGSTVYLRNVAANTTIATYLPPFYGLYDNTGNNLISYSRIQYNHDWLIDSSNIQVTINATQYTINATQELQLANGKFQSAKELSGAGNPDGCYVDYSNFYNNSNINYSDGSVFGADVYKFATFVWRYDGALASVGFDKFKFTFVNFRSRNASTLLGTNTTYGTTYVTNNSNTANQRFFINYRLEEIDSNGNTEVLPTGTNTSGTTIWADANSYNGTYISSNDILFSTDNNTPAQMSSAPVPNTSGLHYNYPTDNTIMRAPPSINYQKSGENLVVTVSSILYTTSKKCFIYCRIGLPMIDNYTFDYVTMSLEA